MKTEKTSRLFFIDHLRVGLAILVVLHHVALVYGASLEGFYYVEPPFTSPIAFLALLVFAMVNQTWFMGAFFLLAGYVTSGSYDRRGAASFLKSRLLRLGLPVLLFVFVLNPLSRIGWWLMPSALTGITTPLTWQAYPRMIGLGPLWFAVMLLIFNLGYAGWRALWRRLAKGPSASTAQPAPAPGYLGIGVFVLALALVSYLVRMVIPLDQTIFQFPSLAYLPQYLSFFVVGIVAARRDWFRTLPTTMGAVGFAAAVVASVILFPLAFSGQPFSLALSPALDNAMGHGHWQSAVYALWDTILAVGLCLGFITLFRRVAKVQRRFGRFLSQHSYAVYVIHIPIIVFVTYGLRAVTLAPLLKFGLASVILVPVCFAIAYVIRKLPLVSKVL